MGTRVQRACRSRYLRIPSGRQNRCRITGAPLGVAADWFLAYARYWTGAFDRLEQHFLESPEPEEPEP
jgi:hypothetical protein